MDFCVSTASLIWGVIKRFYFLLPTLLLDPFDLAERLLPLTYSPPQWLTWVLLGFGLFMAIALAYYEVWRKQTAQRFPRVKRLLRESADKGLQIEEQNELTGETLYKWRDEVQQMLEQNLGQPQANTFRRIIENQLSHASPNEVPIEGHALHAGVGWLNARSEQITESDIAQ